MPAVAYRWFGGVAKKLAPSNGPLAETLFQAAMPIRSDRYMADSLFWALLAAASGALVGMTPLALAGFKVSPVTLIPLVFAPTILFGLTFVSFVITPGLRKSERGRELDANLPHGLNYLLSLASGGLQPRAMFHSLAKQRVFGALAEEAGLISRDLDLLGMDLLTALRMAQERSPSEKFKEFLQGAISSFSSGVDLEAYLKAKGEQYTREEIESQRASLDTIGLMAETFLVVVVASPLFMLVLLSVMTLTMGDQGITFGYLLVLAYMPIAQFGIGFIVNTMNPRVWS